MKKLNGVAMRAPVVIFAYKREKHLKQCINSLEKCIGASETDVIVYSDSNRGESDFDSVEKVRALLRELRLNSMFRTLSVIEQKENKGLAKSIIEGVSSVINQYGKVIVVEDDLVVSEDFLQYMNDGLDYYADDKRYGEIVAYTFGLKGLKRYEKDIYVMKKGDCWGWATWKDRWEDVDWELQDFEDYLHDGLRRRAFSRMERGLEEQLILQKEGKLDAWAARWIFHLFNKGYLTVYPSECRVINCGFDETGEHCSTTSIFDNELYKGHEKCHFEKISENVKFEKETALFGMSFREKTRLRIYRMFGKQT